MSENVNLQALEAQVAELQGKLDACAQENVRLTQENEKLTQELEAARERAATLEALPEDGLLKCLRDEALVSKAEYEALKELYTRKSQELNAAMEEKEQKFAREMARQRAKLEIELRDNRQASQEYVTDSVKTFSDSYNYYLNQVKLLMDTLSDVATQTGEDLFTGENDDLKTRIGHQIREQLDSDADAMKNDGDLVLFGSAKEEEEANDETAPETDGSEDN